MRIELTEAAGRGGNSTAIRRIPYTLPLSRSHQRCLPPTKAPANRTSWPVAACPKSVLRRLSAPIGDAETHCTQTRWAARRRTASCSRRRTSRLFLNKRVRKRWKRLGTSTSPAPPRISVSALPAGFHRPPRGNPHAPGTPTTLQSATPLPSLQSSDMRRRLTLSPRYRDGLAGFFAAL